MHMLGLRGTDGALGPIGAPLDATHDLTEEQSVPMVDVRASDARVLAAAVAQGGVVVTLSSDGAVAYLTFILIH